MLKNQLSKGNNGLVKHKYITFSIEADSLAAAKARLARIETDVLNNFKVLGVAARPMTGYDRLKVLHGVFHPEGEPFSFDWAWLAPSGFPPKTLLPRRRSVSERDAHSAWAQDRRGVILTDTCAGAERPHFVGHSRP